MAKNPDPRLSELRQVTVAYEDGGHADYIVLADEVDRFIEATRRLHVDPGVNPHNGNPARRAVRISLSHLTMRGPFWWTSPELRSGAAAGAHVIDADRTDIVFSAADKGVAAA